MPDTLPTELDLGRSEQWDERRLNPDEVHEYFSYDNEYDEILMFFLRRHLGTIHPHARVWGPTGCGKTTLSKNMAVDIAAACDLARETNLPVLASTKSSLLDAIQNEESPTPDCVSEHDGELDIDESWTLGKIFRYLHDELLDTELESVPFFDVTMSHASNAADLIGHPDVNEDGSTQFVYGTVTKALKASQDGPVVLLLDEINRAPTAAKDELYDVLDGRTKVSIEGMGGGEVIEGVSENLLVISTMNKGQGHHVEPIDQAEKRRLGPTWQVSYPGYAPGETQSNPEPEIQIVEERTAANRVVAERIVGAANEIRGLADDTDTNVSYGVPTSNVLEWAELGAVFQDMDNPLVQAGKHAVSEPLFDHSEQERQKVERTISTEMEGMAFNPDENSEWAEGGVARLVCQECSWTAPEHEAPQEALDFLSCPECEGVCEHIPAGNDD